MATKVYMLEDDADDRYLTQEVLEGMDLDLSISYFTNSNELLREINREMPSLVLIDYNSSPENGLEVLKKIKSTTIELPVVILTENNYSSMKKSCYAAGASSVIAKPRGMSETREKIQTFFNYWLNVAEV